MFVRLIHDGQLRLEQVEDHSEDELRGILDQCGQSVASDATKVGDGQRARQPLPLFFFLLRSQVNKTTIKHDKGTVFLSSGGVEFRYHVINPTRRVLTPRGPHHFCEGSFCQFHSAFLWECVSIPLLFPSPCMSERTAGLRRLLVHASAQRPLHRAAALGSAHSRQAVQALPAQGKTSIPHPTPEPRMSHFRPPCDVCFQVVCGSKYLVRGETARDHVDLLLSSRYWPPVYVSDCARMVALCADVQHPELATRMWGRNQGCFSDPFEKPKVSE